jgi:hypothetical protein
MVGQWRGAQPDISQVSGRNCARRAGEPGGIKQVQAARERVRPSSTLPNLPWLQRIVCVANGSRSFGTQDLSMLLKPQGYDLPVGVALEVDLGVSVLIVHHAGKDGAQRGTGRREDVLDTSLSLRRPSDYNPTQGAASRAAMSGTFGPSSSKRTGMSRRRPGGR